MYRFPSRRKATTVRVRNGHDCASGKKATVDATKQLEQNAIAERTVSIKNFARSIACSEFTCPTRRCRWGQKRIRFSISQCAGIRAKTISVSNCKTSQNINGNSIARQFDYRFYETYARIRVSTNIINGVVVWYARSLIFFGNGKTRNLIELQFR